MTLYEFIKISDLASDMEALQQRMEALPKPYSVCHRKTPETLNDLTMGVLLDQGKNRNAAGPSPDIMSLRGLRMAFASETDEGQRFSSTRVKWFSGGDTLIGRYPHDKRNISFEPTHLLVLLTNHKPHAPASDFAFWERLLLVDFPLSFVDRKPQNENERPMDKGLKDRLLQELPGIAAWLVRGCLEWQRVGIAPPAKVREATSEYRRDEDLLADFVDECCDLQQEGQPEIRSKASDLYDAFCAWFKQLLHHILLLSVQYLQYNLLPASYLHHAQRQ